MIAPVRILSARSYGLACRACIMGLLLFLAGAGARAQDQPMDLSFLSTRAEASEYEQTTGYDEAIGFLEVAAAQTSDLHLTYFGYSQEGRPLPLVVWGIEDAKPASILADGRLRIFIQANIHAGEVCGKEAMLALVRDLAAGRYESWKDSVILLIAPVYNADGNERVSLYNRPRQNGPIGGMGQRPNAQGLDLNRDHMKVASPEARSLLGMMNRYDPEVLIDLHTTNGTQHGYHLTYSPPLNPNTHPAIDSLLRRSLLPEVTDRIRARYGWEFYYYGNLPFRSSEPGWYTFDHRPRFNNNYVGLRNRVAILSEAYAYASFRERVLSSRAFVEEVIGYAARNAPSIRAANRVAEDQPIPGLEMAVRSDFKPSDAPVDILLGSAKRIRNPYSGADMLEMEPDTRRESMIEYGSFQATETIRAPEGYLISRELGPLLNLLDDHGIAWAENDIPDGALERFRIDSTLVADREFQGVRERTVFGAWERAQRDHLPSDLVYVSTRQSLGRLAVYLLEPRSDDGAANWGVLDRALQDAPFYPVLRVVGR